jgi:hypothetical protein
VGLVGLGADLQRDLTARNRLPHYPRISDSGEPESEQPWPIGCATPAFGGISAAPC